MEPEQSNDRNRPAYYQEQHQHGNKVLAGLVVVSVGVILLLQRMGYPIPVWVLSWEMLLVAIGLFVGLRHGFRGIGWAIPMFIGTAFLIKDFYPELAITQYIWPALVILLGLIIIFKPRGVRRRHWERRWERKYRRFGDIHNEPPPADGRDRDSGTTNKVSSEDYFDHTVIFGSQQKVLISKDFRGGDLTTFFGGASLNFIQADIKDKAVLDVTQVFGGLEIIIPPHWKVQSELVTIFGGVEQKRMGVPDPVNAGSPKVLVLEGTVIFGGIEIKSY